MEFRAQFGASRGQIQTNALNAAETGLFINGTNQMTGNVTGSNIFDQGTIDAGGGMIFTVSSGQQIQTRYRAVQSVQADFTQLFVDVMPLRVK
jgi:hypothetical protein